MLKIPHPLVVVGQSADSVTIKSKHPPNLRRTTALIAGDTPQDIVIADLTLKRTVAGNQTAWGAAHADSVGVQGHYGYSGVFGQMTWERLVIHMPTAAHKCIRYSNRLDL